MEVIYSLYLFVELELINFLLVHTVISNTNKVQYLVCFFFKKEKNATLTALYLF